jgi:Tfp pilus assembly protein PilP
MKHLDKVIFLAACIYLGTTVFWSGSSKKLSGVAQVPPTKSEASNLAGDRSFSAYLGRSLDAIAQKPTTSEETKETSIVARPPQKSATVVEKIYVPVYKQTQPSPVTPSQPKSAKQTLPLPPSASTPSPQTTAAVAPSERVSQLESSSLILVGLLESGDRSSALFKIDGTTRRISLGEPIGASGWTLLSVQNQQAIVSAGDKTRSLEVGNQF